MSDQTVGITTPGDKSGSGENYLLASLFTTPAVAGGGTCTFYVYVYSASEPYPRILGGVWANDGGHPAALLATGPTLTPTGTGSAWYSGSFTWNDIAASTDYWIGFVTEVTDGTLDVCYNSTGTGSYKGPVSFALPDPFGLHSDIGRTYTSYVKYPAATASFARPSSDVAGGTFRSIVTTAPFGPRVIA